MRGARRVQGLPGAGCGRKKKPRSEDRGFLIDTEVRTAVRVRVPAPRRGRDGAEGWAGSAKGGAGHDHVAARFDGFGFEIALEMREEADDRGALLELGLDLGDQGHGLGSRVVEVEDDERWALFLGRSMIFATVSGSFLTKATLMPSLRAVSLIFAKKNRSSMKK